MANDVLVEGESAELLMRVFMRMKFRAEPDGMVHSQLRVPAAEFQPLERALMRVEAELLLADAENVGTADDAHRTPPQRRCDAFVELVLRTARALELSM